MRPAEWDTLLAALAGVAVPPLELERAVQAMFMPVHLSLVGIKEGPRADLDPAKQVEALARMIVSMGHNAAGMLEKLSLPACTTDADGVFLSVNTAYSRFYGYEKDELIGKGFTMLLPVEIRDLAMSAHRALEPGVVYPASEWGVEDRFGRQRTVVIATGVLDVLNIRVTLLMDLSDPKAAE